MRLNACATEFSIYLFQTAQTLLYLKHNFLHRLGNALAQTYQDASSMLGSDDMHVDLSVLLCPILVVDNLKKYLSSLVIWTASISS